MTDKVGLTFMTCGVQKTGGKGQHANRVSKKTVCYGCYGDVLQKEGGGGPQQQNV